jgi:thiol-disulfide isomerase/thioredoxin
MKRISRDAVGAVALACLFASSYAFTTHPAIAQRGSIGTHRIPSTTTINTALHVVADAEKNEVNNKKSQERVSSRSSWIPAVGGGFFPNLRENKVIEVKTMQDYKVVVADEKERLVCVKFYAPWCRSCAAIKPLFKQLTHLHPSVKYVEVPLTKENAFLHEGLGVPSLPYAHIYHPEAGLVEERKINKNMFGEFRDEILKSYIDGYCPIDWDDFSYC